nr:hypothetical protein CFP56_19921 [Quercus suber]
MEEIANEATGYFDNLFCAVNCDPMKEFLNAVPRKVTPEMHDTLSKLQWSPHNVTLNKARDSCFMLVGETLIQAR